jgi:hypothetical protein
MEIRRSLRAVTGSAAIRTGITKYDASVSHERDNFFERFLRNIRNAGLFGWIADDENQEGLFLSLSGPSQYPI